MRFHTTLTLLLMLMTAGCVQHHYSPNFIHTPYIEQKGDGMVTAAASGFTTGINGDFHASYSPSQNISVMLNYFRVKSSYEEVNFFGSPNYRETLRGQLLEGAIGAYKSVSFGTGALYAGWGLGQMQNDYGLERLADLRLRRFFIQPTFTFKNNWLRLGMAMRLVRLHYPKADVDFRIDQSDIEILQRLEQNSPFWLPEIGGTLGVHFKPVVVSVHSVLVLSPDAYRYNFDRTNLGVGLSLELNDLRKKRASSPPEEEKPQSKKTKKKKSKKRKSKK